MSRVVYLSDERERQDFAERAAAKFAENPKLWTYSDDNPQPGAYLALRWGMHDRAVMVVKLAEDVEPVTYMDLVPRGAA